MELSGPEGVHLNLGLSRNIGKISGLILGMYGQQYQLVETERVIGGVDYSPIDDPDTYRALVDNGQVAQEERDLRTFEKVRPHIESAAFCICPACLDRFDVRDDCPTCVGKGFVRKPVGSLQTRR